ncbi:yciC [Symbiodinium necroappetens]|uniref:YciC protein n=1 Tax=Symbiodinium necroappetens TaxID=1628268 RepID=A0A812W6N8_9DINO|nr:yciC [Symbiodinium necroappetens]
MGVSGGNWDDDEEVGRNAPTVTYGLEPFVFDPGPQPTQEELANDAERRVRQDKRFREALRRQKAAITAILQGCLEKVNGQLERGEAVCQKAHFPLLHPVEFEDLEALPQPGQEYHSCSSRLCTQTRHDSSVASAVDDFV